jgi:putative DNA primase/helicase
MTKVIDIDAELARMKAARKAREAPRQAQAESWPAPQTLPSGLLPVPPFKTEFLPAALAPWIEDISERLQCPPDYVAVAAMTALGSIIGRRLGIKPQLKTDWLEIPNVWGAFIGRPGMLKSPAMNEALKPIHHIEAEAADSEALRTGIPTQGGQRSDDCGQPMTAA